jgi:hypothetical protein
MPRGLFGLLADHDASDIRPVGLTGVFHFLGVFAPRNLRGILGSEAGVSLQRDIVGPENLIEPSQKRLILVANYLIKNKPNPAPSKNCEGAATRQFKFKGCRTRR